MLAVALAACSGPGDVRRDVVSNAPPAEITVLRGCPRDASLLTGDDDARPRAGLVPAGFAPTVVVRCAATDLEQRGGVDRQHFTESRAAVTDQLMHALALPDQEFTDNHVACSAAGRSLVVLYLSEADHHTIRPRLPRDPCTTRREVDEALSSLSWSKQATFRVDVPRER